MSNPVEAPGGEILLYQAPDGEARVDVRLDHETVWLTQDQMSQLFGRERSVITKHVRNVFREGELEPEATCAKFAQVQTEGERSVTREVDHYNLDVIISVGYRVKSSQGTRFRQWATRVLREHLVQGCTSAGGMQVMSSLDTCPSWSDAYSSDTRFSAGKLI